VSAPDWTAAQLAVVIRTATSEIPVAEAVDWQFETLPEIWEGPGTQWLLRARWQGERATAAGLLITRRLTSPPGRLLAPSVFYGDNGVGNRATRYPRLGPLDRAAFTAPGWDFAAERMALPAVFVWDADGCAWLATEPNGSGVGFRLEADGAELRAHRPGIEGPFRHDRRDEAPLLPLRDLQPGDVLEARVWTGVDAGGAADAFAPVQRALQTAWGGGPARPVDPASVRAAAEAAVAGLLRWHYRPDLGAAVLTETVSFDGAQTRDEMHLAWVSGAPAAYALLRHGAWRGDAAAAEAGARVLDTVASGLAPCGAFWGIWTPRGWRAGWNGDPQTLHARTLAEATLFMLRALAIEPRAPWEAAARSNLDFCLRAMDARGSPGSYYHAQTGAVLDRRGTAGLLWAAALAEGAAILDAPGYLAAALRVGQAYAESIRQGRLLGAPEDIGLCPSSEDGYNAVIAMIALYEATGDPEWRDLARAGADWMLTFRWSYDVAFPAGSPLARRGFHTRGADGASPSNHHLHDYGLICQPELRRLSAALTDPWYAARAADHLACFLGEIALRDHQFGGPERRGMLPEQWYTADWAREGRAGELGPVSHSWCLGLLLFAADDWLGDPRSSLEMRDRCRKTLPLRRSP
jgi:hypothetical protein